MTFEHPFWGLSTSGNLAAFNAQSTHLMCSENRWSVQINTEKCSLSFKSSINISDPPGTLFWNHLSPCHEGNVSRWGCGDYTRESCKSFFACRSFLTEPLCKWNLRVISDLQKHKRQISMLFVTKKELKTQYSCLTKNVTCFRSEVSSSTEIRNNRRNCKMLKKGYFIHLHHSELSGSLSSCFIVYWC